MLKNLKYTLFLILFILSFPGMEGQPLKDITSKFLKYCSEVPREEVYLHTDRVDYIAGEEMWFSAYMFDRLSGKPGYNSSIIYVEVLNSENHAVGQKRIMTEKGFGNGEIMLPDTLTTGCYTLRAYTGIMKNYLPGNCFLKKIRIYNALNTGNGITCRTELNPSGSGKMNSDSQSQFNFTVDNHKGDWVEFVITSSDNFRSMNSGLCYIFIETRGKIDYTSVINLASSNRYIVPSKSLTSGINHITFFDVTGKPVSEKYIYTKGSKNAATIILSPDSCRKRERVSLEIDPPGQRPSKVDSLNMSISITPISSKISNELSGYMVFGSEFGILPDNISGLNPDDIPSEVLDSFLANARSNWIDWDRILSAKNGEMKDLAEKGSHFLYGRLLNRNTHQPVQDKILYLSSPGKNASFQYAVADKNGVFRFIIPVSNIEQDLIIQPEENDVNFLIEIISSFADANPPEEHTIAIPDKSIPSWIVKWSTNYQVNRIYGIGFSAAPENRDEKIPEKKRFYGRPDIELVMDDYIKLPVMQEVFYELLPGVSLKSRKNTYDISIVDPVDNKVQKRPPVLFIDGVIINDATVIANLEPGIVERIDVVKEKYFMGDYVFYGLVNVITRAGDFSCATLPEKALRIKYRAIDPEMSFAVPEFSDTSKVINNIPDFRNTLYWNPSVKPAKDGKYSVSFTTSDIPGEYEINVQGLTSDGKQVSARKTFRVN
jgi:hypothetical protein